MLKLDVIQGSQAVHEASVRPQRAGAASAYGKAPNRRLRRLLLALPMSWAFIAASPAHALLLTWDVDNQASGNWYDRNWIGAGPSGVPTADDDVVLPEGSQVVVDQDAVARSVKITADGAEEDTFLHVRSGAFRTGNIFLDAFGAADQNQAFLLVAADASIVGANFSYQMAGTDIPQLALDRWSECPRWRHEASDAGSSAPLSTGERVRSEW